MDTVNINPSTLKATGPPGADALFSGIPFSRKTPYEQARAKRLLDGIRQFLIRSGGLKEAYPNFESEPSSPIRERDVFDGSHSRHGVWCPIKLEDNDKPFNECLHIVIEITSSEVDFHMTVANDAPKAPWSRVLAAEDHDWQKIFAEIIGRISSGPTSGPKRKWPQPYFRLLQCHYDQRGGDYVAAGMLFFSLGTVTEGGDAKVKRVPEWKGNLKKLISEAKARANTQLDLGIRYIYSEFGEGSIIRKPEFKEEAVRACLALKPFYDFLGEE